MEGTEEHHGSSEGVADQTREKAGDVAEQAREKASEVTDQAREQAQNLASQAQETVRSQVDERSTQAGERITGTAGDLRSVGEELRNQGKGTPAKYVEQAADRIERTGGYLRDSDADRLLSDAEDFGRRQPWVVLAGAAVVGIAAARFLKASSRDRYRSRSDGKGPSRPTSLPAGASPSAATQRSQGATAEPAGVGS